MSEPETSSVSDTIDRFDADDLDFIAFGMEALREVVESRPAPTPDLVQHKFQAMGQMSNIMRRARSMADQMRDLDA